LPLAEFGRLVGFAPSSIKIGLGIADFVLERQISAIKMQLHRFDFLHRPIHVFVLPILHHQYYHFVETRHVDWHYW